MKILFSSATRLVLLWFAIAVGAFTWYGIVDPKDFMTLVFMVFSHYYADKNRNKEDIKEEPKKMELQ